MEWRDYTTSWCLFPLLYVVMNAALVVTTTYFCYVVEETRWLVLSQPFGKMLVEGLHKPTLVGVFLAMKDVCEAKVWMHSTECLNGSYECKHFATRTGATSCNTDLSIGS